MRFTLNALLITWVFASLSCQSTETLREGNPGLSSFDQALKDLSAVELHSAVVGLRVAYDHEVSAWKSPGEVSALGCPVTERQAEQALFVVEPWLERKIAEEAQKLASEPEKYELPFLQKTCLETCFCQLGIRIIDAAKRVSSSSVSSATWKKRRSELAALQALYTPEQAQNCAEANPWICKHPLIQATSPSAPPGVSR